MDYLISNLSETIIVLGLILLAIEVIVLGFSTFVLFFIGCGLIISGGLMSIGIIPETILDALLSTAITATLVAIFGWKPIKRFQNNVESKQVKNDMIGDTFILTDNLDIGNTITYRLSGIDWQVKSSSNLALGTEVKIVHMQVGLLTVERAD